jgi:hypothetical protein
MCSLSWLRGGGRLLVVMNRDERLDRAPAQPPQRWAEYAFTAPRDPDGGGTWIAVRDSGLVIALLNHHPPARPGRAVARRRTGLSRGRLVTALAAEAGVPDAARLRRSMLEAFAPFRLFVAGPRAAPAVFTWDGARLSARRLDPRLGFLTSSSWNPRAVLPARHARFRAFVRQHGGRPSRAALVAFHADAGHPRGGAWAIRMTRDDAGTVSTTVVEAGQAGVRMRYRARRPASR